MKRILYEISCDCCGFGEHYKVGGNFPVEKQAREHGWIITKSGKHYCCIGCYNALERPAFLDNNI